METLHRLEITLPALAGEDDLSTLQEAVPWGWEESALHGQTRLTVYCQEHGQAVRVQHAVTKLFPGARIDQFREESRDWMDGWKDFFTPIQVQELFTVLPPWLEEETDLQGRTPILINPKTAFGTGHHATTALCLEALAELFHAGTLDRGGSFLDLGTGSGILGIGCARLGLSGLGLDIDPEAVRNAKENRGLNAIPEERFGIVAGTLDCLRPARRFDLILANILAGPLMAMAPALTARRAQGSILVLSGILQEQMERVIRSYRNQGLAQPRILIRDEWCALLWHPAVP